MSLAGWLIPARAMSCGSAIGRCAGHKPERDAERFALRLGQLRQLREARRAKLLQRREWKLAFRLAANGAQHFEVARARDHVLQERRLADAGLAVDDDCLAPAFTRIVEQLIERAALHLATEEGGPSITDQVHASVR